MIHLNTTTIHSTQQHNPKIIHPPKIQQQADSIKNIARFIDPHNPKNRRPNEKTKTHSLLKIIA
jgi:hypothetical protein